MEGFFIIFMNMAKYQDQIRDMFIDVLSRDPFFCNVDPEPAIDFVMKQMNESYESMSLDIETGVANGCEPELQLSMFAEAVAIYLKL